MTILSLSEGIAHSDMNELKKQANEYLKIKCRIRRHGENIVKFRGRPKTSDSQKKNRRKLYLEKIREEKKANGTYRGRGRPKKTMS